MKRNPSISHFSYTHGDSSRILFPLPSIIFFYVEFLLLLCFCFVHCSAHHKWKRNVACVWLLYIEFIGIYWFHANNIGNNNEKLWIHLIAIAIESSFV